MSLVKFGLIGGHMSTRRDLLGGKRSIILFKFGIGNKLFDNIVWFSVQIQIYSYPIIIILQMSTQQFSESFNTTDKNIQENADQSSSKVAAKKEKQKGRWSKT